MSAVSRTIEDFDPMMSVGVSRLIDAENAYLEYEKNKPGETRAERTGELMFICVKRDINYTGFTYLEKRLIN